MPLLLLVGWIVLESWLVVRAVDLVGGLPVTLWLLAAAAAGVLLIRQQGLRCVREMQLATARGELPTLPLLEGLVVLVAGLLLIVPGFLTDAVGASLLLLGLRKRLAVRLGDGIAKARPDLRQPVTLEGEYRRRG